MTYKRFYIWVMVLTLSLSVYADDGDRYATNSVLSSGTWVKVRVKEAGVYQFTNANLRSMGFSNPDNVKLYGMNMEVLPESGLENLGGDLTEIPLYRTGEKVLFYGRGTTLVTLNNAEKDYASFSHFNNPYSSYQYYLLTEGENPKEFATYNYEMGSNAQDVITFPDYSIIESDEFSYMNSGRRFFEGYDYVNGSTKSYTLELPGYSTGAVSLDVQFSASGSTASTIDVTVNDVSVGSISIGKNGTYDWARMSSRSFLLEDDEDGWSNIGERNTVKLTHNRASGVSGHLDYISAGYIRNLNITGTHLLFRPYMDGDIVFHINGANENTVVWKVTRGSEMEGVEASFSSGSLSVPFTSESTELITWKDEELVALNPSATFPTPTTVGKIANQDLHALGNIDLVIVIPTSGKLRSQAQRLADAHLTYDSITSVIVTADQVYNEFSGGTPDATALRRFMKMLYDNATSESNRPKNLLLFGGGVWDNRMVTGSMRQKSADDYLLCYESDNSLSKTDSYVMEEYYTLVDDNASSNLQSAYPRIGVGRIPVVSASDAKIVVDKLIQYMSNAQVGSWKNTLCFICDDGNNNIHMKDGEAIISQTESLYPDYLIRRIYLDTYQRETTSTGNRYPDVEADIRKQMQDGALIMNYTGHGAPGLMTHEQVMKLHDFSEWSSPRLPLWITAACDISPFDMNEENIGVDALLNPSGAAMGFVGTARTVYSGPNRDFNLQYMRYVLSHDSYGRQYTIGEAISLAKSQLVNRSSAVNRFHFCLLGDPAIKLATPKYSVMIDAINGKSTLSGEIESVSAGEEVTVEGHIENESGLTADTFSGLVYPTILDNLEKITCLNNPVGEDNGNDYDTDPYVFDARTKTLYTLVDSVSNGRFTFKFPIPLDNNYSGDTGLISLYATNNEHSHEAHGRNGQFKTDGTSAAISVDNAGPEITPIYLNTSNFQNGDVVNETPLLIADLLDKDGINMTGNGIGHDIIAMIDNNESTTYSLNGHFTPSVGDYRKGHVEFSIPELEDGHHTLTMRAYDILNNPSTAIIDFYVNNGEKPKIYSLLVNSPVSDQAVFTIENDRPQTNLTVGIKVYDISGRLLYQTKETNFSSSSSYSFVWNLNESDSHLVPGIYIVKASISTSDGPQATESKKFIVVRH